MPAGSASALRSERAGAGACGDPYGREQLGPAHGGLRSDTKTENQRRDENVNPALCHFDTSESLRRIPFGTSCEGSRMVIDPERDKALSPG